MAVGYTQASKVRALVKSSEAASLTVTQLFVPLVAVVLSQETVYGLAVSSAARLAPSSRNCTPATPTLSEASAVTFTVPLTVALLAGAVMLTVGAMVSAVAIALASLDEALTL